MMEEGKLPHLPGFLSVREASEVIGISEPRIYAHVASGRLKANKVGNAILIAVQDAEDFKHTPPGRLRSVPPRWRKYNARNKVLTTEIQLRVKPGREQALAETLEKIYQENTHTLTGSITRFIIHDVKSPDRVTMWIAWKSTELPDEKRRAQEMEAFKAELADVLDWDTATISEAEGLIYT